VRSQSIDGLRKKAANKISTQDFESHFALGERLLVERRDDMAAFNQEDDPREMVSGDNANLAEAALFAEGRESREGCSPC
jgi:hypothetical protein